MYEQTVAELSFELEQTRLAQETKHMTVIAEETNDLEGLEQASDDSSDVVDMNGDGDILSDNQCELVEFETDSAGIFERNKVRDLMHGNPRESMLMQNKASFVSSTQNSFVLT